MGYITGNVNIVIKHYYMKYKFETVNWWHETQHLPSTKFSSSRSSDSAGARSRPTQSCSKRLWQPGRNMRGVTCQLTSCFVASPSGAGHKEGQALSDQDYIYIYIYIYVICLWYTSNSMLWSGIYVFVGNIWCNVMSCNDWQPSLTLCEMYNMSCAVISIMV